MSGDLSRFTIFLNYCDVLRDFVNCYVDIQSGSDASWEGQSGRSVPPCKLLRCSVNVSRDRHSGTAIRNVIMHFKSAHLRRGSEWESPWKGLRVLLMRRVSERQDGLSAGGTCSQWLSKLRISSPPVTHSAPPAPALLGERWELGWSSLQNTLALISWWGEPSLKIMSGNNTWKGSLQDNSASWLRSRLGLGLCLHYKYESYWEELKWAGARLWELKFGERRKWAPLVQSGGLRQCTRLISPSHPGCGSVCCCPKRQ